MGRAFEIENRVFRRARERDRRSSAFRLTDSDLNEVMSAQLRTLGPELQEHRHSPTRRIDRARDGRDLTRTAQIRLRATDRHGLPLRGFLTKGARKQDARAQSI